MQDLLRFMRIGVVAEGYRQLVSQLVFGGMFGLELLVENANMTTVGR